MKNNEYESVEQMDADLNMMFENAKRYNVSNSHIYKRALKLQHILQVLSLHPPTPQIFPDLGVKFLLSILAHRQSQFSLLNMFGF